MVMCSKWRNTGQTRTFMLEIHCIPKLFVGLITLVREYEKCTYVISKTIENRKTSKDQRAVMK